MRNHNQAAGRFKMITLQNASETGKAQIVLQTMTAELAASFGSAFAAIEPWSRYPFSPRALTAFLSSDEPDAARFAMFANGDPAGAMVIRKRWMRGPYLQFLGVLPEFQRHGIGRLSLAWFEASAFEDAERNIWVAASDFNTRALHFYERHGFQRVASLDGLVADGITEILLRKRL